nr:MAG TPA: hypothetical protein [Crassvirales sp.]
MVNKYNPSTNTRHYYSDDVCWAIWGHIEV